ncbi:MAG: dipeptidase, partial [Clostridia bacterium]|nr:dipeptidase [Clostridia bacterium]
MQNTFFVADMHCDTIGFVYNGRCSGLLNEYNTSRLYPHLQVYAMFCEEESENAAQSFERLRRYIDIYREHTEKENITVCLCADDIENALLRGDIKLSMLSIEGCECLNGSIENLHRVYEAGVRIAGLVWNNNNSFACGSLVSGTSEDRGLTKLGVKLVEECEKLGIIIDLSHSSDRTVREVFEITKRPLAATHSNFRSVCRHNRNLTDEYAAQIAHRGGYIGLNLYYKFAEGDSEEIANNYKMSSLCNHVDYALKLGLGDNLGFGFDIDGVGDIYPADVNMRE